MHKHNKICFHIKFCFYEVIFNMFHRSPSKSKKTKAFKFPSKKEKREKSREKDAKEKDVEKEKDKKKKDKDDKDSEKDKRKDKDKDKSKQKLKDRKKGKHTGEEGLDIGGKICLFNYYVLSLFKIYQVISIKIYIYYLYQRSNQFLESV